MSSHTEANRRTRRWFWLSEVSSHVRSQHLDTWHRLYAELERGTGPLRPGGTSVTSEDLYCSSVSMGHCQFRPEVLPEPGEEANVACGLWEEHSRSLFWEAALAQAL